MLDRLRAALASVFGAGSSCSPFRPKILMGYQQGSMWRPRVGGCECEIMACADREDTRESFVVYWGQGSYWVLPLDVFATRFDRIQ